MCRNNSGFITLKRNNKREMPFRSLHNFHLFIAINMDIWALFDWTKNILVRFCRFCCCSCCCFHWFGLFQFNQISKHVSRMIQHIFFVFEYYLHWSSRLSSNLKIFEFLFLCKYLKKMGFYFDLICPKLWLFCQRFGHCYYYNCDECAKLTEI